MTHVENTELPVVVGGAEQLVGSVSEQQLRGSGNVENPPGHRANGVSRYVPQDATPGPAWQHTFGCSDPAPQAPTSTSTASRATGVSGLPSEMSPLHAPMYAAEATHMDTIARRPSRFMSPS
jgi:hypothetical protein